MTKDLTKKAVEMLLKGATLLAEPCPYCQGVRVMKDGNAFCINCGREPKTKEKPFADKTEVYNIQQNVLSPLKQKLDTLTKELENEKDHEKQQQIIKSINSLVELIEKLKK